ncbi:MAG: nitroreductase family protein, partial [Thermodesulfobacteriota bacterium]
LTRSTKCQLSSNGNTKWIKLLLAMWTLLIDMLIRNRSTREDKEKRKRYRAEVYSLFGAPCMILVTLDRNLPIEYAMLDVGLFMQTFCLLAHEKGLGTCMLAAAVRYPQVSRELIQIPDNKVIIIGTALGYPDWDSPVNLFERERAEVGEFTRWLR